MMKEPKTVYPRTLAITNKISSDAAFGVTDEGEGCYIPASVMRAAKAEEFDRWSAFVVENEHETGNNPWLVTRLRQRVGSLIATESPVSLADAIQEAARDPAPAPAVTPEALGQRAVRLVQESDLTWTHHEIMAEVLDADTWGDAQSIAVATALRQAHRDGLIACASIRQSASQERASALMWAAKVAVFTD